MSKVFRVQGETDFDYIKFNLEYNEEKSILIANKKNTIPYTLDENLTLRLFNRKSKVFIQGQISFILTGVEIKIEDSLIIGIQFHSDKNRATLIYQTYSKISGINLKATQSINFNIPLSFVECPKIKITEEKVKYYISVQTNISETIKVEVGGLFLQQYNFTCMEMIASN